MLSGRLKLASIPDAAKGSSVQMNRLTHLSWIRGTTSVEFGWRESVTKEKISSHNLFMKLDTINSSKRAISKRR